MNNKITGQRGEELIKELLKNESFIILEQNYKKFFGEIDIIAQKANLIVFVEVKTRKNAHVSLFELVGPTKQRKIIQVAQEYICKKLFTECTYRFDVALIEMSNNAEPDIQYIPNAFNKREL